MGNIFLTGTAKVTKTYIYIQPIKGENKNMNKEHNASNFLPDKRRDPRESQQVRWFPHYKSKQWLLQIF